MRVEKKQLMRNWQLCFRAMADFGRLFRDIVITSKESIAKAKPTDSARCRHCYVLRCL